MESVKLTHNSNHDVVALTIASLTFFLVFDTSNPSDQRRLTDEYDANGAPFATDK